MSGWGGLRKAFQVEGTGLGLGNNEHSHEAGVQGRVSTVGGKRKGRFRLELIFQLLFKIR